LIADAFFGIFGGLIQSQGDPGNIWKPETSIAYTGTGTGNLPERLLAVIFNTIIQWKRAEVMMFQMRQQYQLNTQVVCRKVVTCFKNTG
jgi:hypothetical protein